MNFITILTAAAIFLIVAAAFRSLSVPLVLTLLIQSAVFITMGTVYIQGAALYYMPLLIVQCLLMGATVDYGILYCSYYREARITLPVKESVISALDKSVHTIITSSSILILVTGIIGVFLLNRDRPIAEIMLIIARGALCSSLLVVFILPGIMCALDRVARGRKALKR